jgi:hypothetical protein
MKAIYWESSKEIGVELIGTINGYKVGYDNNAELCWVIISKSSKSPIILAGFLSQDDMELMMNAKLVEE